MGPADFPRGMPIGGAIPRPNDFRALHPAPTTPLPHTTADVDPAWIESAMHRATDVRAFRRGQYRVARVRTGADYATALDEFRGAVADGSKTALLAIFAENAQCGSVADELRVLGAAMRDAGLTDDPLRLIDGRMLSTPMTVVCPVTGRETGYEFLSFALCQSAANPRDPLYDPLRSAPFSAVHVTSEALAFARFVDDEALRTFGQPVYRMTHDRDAVETLFGRCVMVWQDLMAATISKASGTMADPLRGARLSEDRAHWYAAHNEATFADLDEQALQHEMPTIYAARLAVKWSDNLFGRKLSYPNRAGNWWRRVPIASAV